MELIEFQQCLDEETAADTIRLLSEAGIPYRKSTGQPAFNVTSLGGSSEVANEKIIISVASSDYPKAREVVEAEALLSEIPQGHYLLTTTTSDLQEILQDAAEWSPFDVAHARRLLTEKGIEIESPEKLAAAYQAKLKEGKKASLSLLALAIILPVIGAITTIILCCIIGSGIALSITFMKSKTLEGRYPTFDKKSRKIAAIISIWAIGVTLYGFYIWGKHLYYGDSNLYIPS